MTCCHGAGKPVLALRGPAACLAGLGLLAAAAVIWAIPAAAVPVPPQGPGSGVSVACDNFVITPATPGSCTITGLMPSESASVLVAGTSQQVTAPPADSAGSSTFALPPIPATRTATRIVEVTAQPGNRTSTTSVTVSNQTSAGDDASSSPALGGSGTPGPASAAAKQKTTIPTHALLAILVAVVGIVVLASRKHLQRMKP